MKAQNLVTLTGESVVKHIRREGFFPRSSFGLDYRKVVDG